MFAPKLIFCRVGQVRWNNIRSHVNPSFSETKHSVSVVRAVFTTRCAGVTSERTVSQALVMCRAQLVSSLYILQDRMARVQSCFCH